VELEPDGAVRIVGDPDRLDQVLSNLVDNALRHGGGPVVVDLTAVGRGGRAEPGGSGSVVLTVTDAGAGIAEERPFDRFSGSRRGLGLSIVRAVVTAHGGTVETGPGPEGTGTWVTVTLPGGS
jgi:signal transduction histidine kinase